MHIPTEERRSGYESVQDNGHYGKERNDEQHPCLWSSSTTPKCMNRRPSVEDLRLLLSRVVDHFKVKRRCRLDRTGWYHTDPVETK